MSSKRVILKLEIAGQSTDINRTVSAASHWDDVNDDVLRDFVHTLLVSALDTLGYAELPPVPTLLTLRANPEMPTDEMLNSMFDLGHNNAGAGGGVRAIWRAGCDAGMVAP